MDSIQKYFSSCLRYNGVLYCDNYHFQNHSDVLQVL